MVIQSFLEFPFLQRAMLAVIVVSLVCAVTGVFVVMGRLAFFTDTIAHSALTGIALGVLLGINPFWSALVFGLLVAFGVVYLKDKGRLNTDTALGLFLPFAMAVGILLLQIKHDYTPDLMSYLFGSILAVSLIDILLEVIIAIVILVWIYRNYQQLLYVSFDRESAWAAGVSIRKVEYAMMALTSMVVVASLQVAGIALVGALIVIPAASAKNVASSFKEVIGWSILFGVLSGVIGLVMAVVLDVSGGAAIVITAMMIFLISFVFRKK